MGAAATLLPEDLPALLAGRSTFRELDAKALAELVRAGELLHLAPNARLERAAGPARMLFVVTGQIGVVRPRSTGLEGATKRSHLPNPGREYLLHLVDGDLFSDRFLSIDGLGEEQRLGCVAVMRSDLLAVPEPTVRALMRAKPAWGDRLRERSAELQRFAETHHAGEARLVQDFFLQHNFSYATTLKIIDLDRCIGCDGCERACADRHGVARLIRRGPVLGRLAFPTACRTCLDHRCFDACGFDAISLLPPNEEVKIDTAKCVGCAACYSACPNDVITMQEKPYTGADFKEQLPRTDLDHRTNVPGLFLAGEATGTALIKLAINSGRRAVEVAAEEIGAARGGDTADVVVVGAGPAGLSAGLTAQELGLRYLLFDKGHFATTINSYPRHKVVMAEPMHIPLYGNLWLKDTTKEELIGHWREIIERTGLEIQSHQPVSDVKRLDDGTFEVTTPSGVHRAKKVVLATGTRGTPRKLGVPGEAEPRVMYQLTEPGDFRGKRALVVGGGDSAVEAAMSLADVPGTTVSLSYRRDSFGRIKARNKTRLDELSAAGRVEVILESSLVSIQEGSVTIKTKAGPRELPNDCIFAMLGGEPPTKFFEKIGIQILEPGTPEMEAFAKSRGNRRYASKCDHCAGHSDQACIAACPTGAILEVVPAEVFPEIGERRQDFETAHFHEGLETMRSTDALRWAGVIGSVLALALTTLIGFECFLRRVFPEHSLLAHWQAFTGESGPVSFASGAGLGYHLGITGTAMMFLTALYPLHSRLGWFRRLAKTPFWLAGHVLVGVLGPALVTYHTTLKLNRWPSVAFWLMWTVVLSGVVGRHVYRWIRTAYGLVDLETKRVDEERKLLLDDVSGKAGHTRIQRALDLERPPTPRKAGPFGAVVLLLASELSAAWEALKLRFVLRTSGTPETRRRAVDVLVTRLRRERRAELLDAIGRSSTAWKRLHLLATIAMFAVAIAHITTAMLFKAA